MSSLICEAGKCTFTRVNTDAPALMPGPFEPPPPCIPCACPWCDINMESFEVGNPNNSFGVASLGVVSCESLQYYSFSSDSCTELQLNPDFRLACGCPVLPPFNDTDVVIVNSTITIDTSSAPWTDVANQDKLSESVAITRDFRNWIFNALDLGNGDSFYNQPDGTEWALLPDGLSFGEARCRISFCSWNECFAFLDPASPIIGKPGVVHVLEEDLYYNIMFTNWTQDSVTAGGGFQYIRDENPIEGGLFLNSCPDCYQARASLAVLRGPIDHSYVNVTVEGVTPEDEDIEIEILSVAQGHNPECNYLTDPNTTDRVRPNARIFGSVAQLRRTRIAGSLAPVVYTINFQATTSSGDSCIGQVTSCVPAGGYQTCDSPYPAFDATSTRYCSAAQNF